MHDEIVHTEKTVFLNQRNISLIYGQRKNFFELTKVLLIRKTVLQCKQIYFFGSKNIFLNWQNFLIQWNCFLSVPALPKRVGHIFQYSISIFFLIKKINNGLSIIISLIPRTFSCFIILTFLVSSWVNSRIRKCCRTYAVNLLSSVSGRLMIRRVSWKKKFG